VNLTPFLETWHGEEPHRFLADVVFERIKDHWEIIFAQLKENESLVILVFLPSGFYIAADRIGYHLPNFITASGVDSQGNRVTALLSHTNVPIVFQVVPRDPQVERKPIGFDIPNSQNP